ncbi:MAG TPA: hypothetical protein VFE72_02955 [Lysobacter sp.]|nr:hypothetical protein [Lysobacter sp.]
MSDHIDGRAPLVPPYVDLRTLRFFLFDVGRFRDSRFVGTVSPEAGFYGIVLWAAAWHQRPAASLPDDDVELAKLAGLGRDLATWARVKRDALHRWVRCNDGRLYHPVIAMKALEQHARLITMQIRSGEGVQKRTGKPFDPTALQARLEETHDHMRRLSEAYDEKPEQPIPPQAALPLGLPAGPPDGDEPVDRTDNRPDDHTVDRPVDRTVDQEKGSQEKGSQVNPEDQKLSLTADGGEDDRALVPAPPKRARGKPTGDELFDRFWEAYPRKEGKQDAVKAWNALCRDTKPTDWPALAERVIGVVQVRSADDAQWLRDNGAFVPHPATFINGGRWEDRYQKIQPRQTRRERNEADALQQAHDWAQGR